MCIRDRPGEESKSPTPEEASDRRVSTRNRNQGYSSNDRDKLTAKDSEPAERYAPTNSKLPLRYALMVDDKGGWKSVRIECTQRGGVLTVVERNGRTLKVHRNRIDEIEEGLNLSLIHI
eukprot:TRINITY_DN29370_c0_g1_i1.p1 TRINITY_DN29370_c0_g1~~TRINITY_DN29370_c0_g1_i1.p1  ORF type:complete len:119 (+),score=24.86 TRINITY_DN29370_c0_g1_i1:48-404(+)